MVSATDVPSPRPPEPPAPPTDPLDVLRAELADLRRQLETNDEEIDFLQVEAARQQRSWYRDPTAMTAVIAVVLSVLSTFLSQYNISSDRQIQERSRLTSIIQQLPAAQLLLQEKPQSGLDNLLLPAGDAATLMDRVESSSFEKIEVATALQLGGDYGRAKELVEKAIVQESANPSTSLVEALLATRVLAQLHYQLGDVIGGRDAYQKTLEMVGKPTPNGDSPLLRSYQAAFTEYLWTGSEFAAAPRDCAATRLHFQNSVVLYQKLYVAPQVQTNLDNLAASVNKACP